MIQRAERPVPAQEVTRGAPLCFWGLLNILAIVASQKPGQYTLPCFPSTVEHFTPLLPSFTNVQRILLFTAFQVILARLKLRSSECTDSDKNRQTVTKWLAKLEERLPEKPAAGLMLREKHKYLSTQIIPIIFDKMSCNPEYSTALSALRESILELNHTRHLVLLAYIKKALNYLYEKKDSTTDTVLESLPENTYSC